MHVTAKLVEPPTLPGRKPPQEVVPIAFTEKVFLTEDVFLHVGLEEYRNQASTMSKLRNFT